MEHLAIAQALEDPHFLSRLSAPPPEPSAWEAALAPLLPIRERLSCQRVLEVLRPQLESMAPEPPEGWLTLTYRTAVSLLFPWEDLGAVQFCLEH